ncbi:hypothetical protein [Streptomyces nigra]
MRPGSLGLSLAFLLAPAGRFGYLAVPVTLVVIARLVGGAGRTRPVRDLDVQDSRPARPVPARV